jgi:uncharacterized protein YodC (DUF2158 family)
MVTKIYDGIVKIPRPWLDELGEVVEVKFENGVITITPYKSDCLKCRHFIGCDNGKIIFHATAGDCEDFCSR